MIFTNAGTGALVDIDPADAKQVLTRTFAKDSGSVMRIDLAGGTAPTVIAAAQDVPVAIAADAERVYWVNPGLYRGTGGLLRSDGPPVANGLDFPSALALDGPDVYVAVTGAPDEPHEGHVVLERIGGQPVELAAGQQIPNAITVDRHRVYWASFGEIPLPNGGIWTRDK